MSAIKTRQRIMIIADDGDTQQLLNNILESEGFDTVTVADNDVIPSLINRLEPDVVILDSMTPDEENFQVLDRIRKHSGVPIIMLAASYDIESLQRAFSLGADDYIRKPLDHRLFIARIRAKTRRGRKYHHTPAPLTA